MGGRSAHRVPGFGRHVLFQIRLLFYAQLFQRGERAIPVALAVFSRERPHRAVVLPDLGQLRLQHNPVRFERRQDAAEVHPGVGALQVGARRGLRCCAAERKSRLACVVTCFLPFALGARQNEDMF